MFKRKAKEKKIKTPRFQTFRDAYKVTKQVKPWIPVALAGIFLASWAIGIGIGAAIGHPFYLAFVSFPLAALFTLLFLHAKQEQLLTPPLKDKWVQAQAY
jgi:hypothetical protein